MQSVCFLLFCDARLRGVLKAYEHQQVNIIVDIFNACMEINRLTWNHSAPYQASIIDIFEKQAVLLNSWYAKCLWIGANSDYQLVIVYGELGSFV